MFTDPTDTARDTTSAEKSDKDTSLSEGQKSAWHKLLYGGLSILAVFVIFIFFLYRRSQKNKHSSGTTQIL